MELQIENYKDKHEYISENGIRSVVYLMDCMEGLKQIPDKYFELAIVISNYFIIFVKNNFYDKRFKTITNWKGWRIFSLR